MYKVSVVIPMYNAERYVERCMNSLINQTTDEFQIIVVDDGSKDKSVEVMQKYKELLGERLLLLKKENGGAASARNMGLAHVDTPYVMFCDIDDYVENEYIARMCKCIEREDADMVCCSYDVNDKQYKLGRQNTGVRYLDDEPDVICETDVLLWNKVYRTSIFRDSKIRMPEGIMFEDNATIPRIVARCSKIVYIEDVLYHYDMSVSDSVMHSQLRHLDDLLVVADVLYQDVLSKKYWAQYMYVITEVLFSFIMKNFFVKGGRKKIAYAYSLFRRYEIDIKNDCFMRQLQNMSKYKRAMYRMLANRNIIGLFCFEILRRLKYMFAGR